MHGKIIKLWVYLKAILHCFLVVDKVAGSNFIYFFISNFNIQHCSTIASVKFAFTQQLILNFSTSNYYKLYSLLRQRKRIVKPHTHTHTL